MKKKLIPVLFGAMLVLPLSHGALAAEAHDLSTALAAGEQGPATTEEAAREIAKIPILTEEEKKTLGPYLLQLAMTIKDRSGDQDAMKKTEAERIGQRLELPREQADSIPVNYYEAEGKGRHPLIVNLHGGSFVGGDADALDSESARIAKDWGADVVTVNYQLARKAEDFRYAEDEVIDTVKYFRAHADEFGINPDEIFLVGHSAGGYYAMHAALELAKEGIPIPVRGQVICYGFLGNIEEEFAALSEKEKKRVAPALFVMAKPSDWVGSSCLSYKKALTAAGVKTTVKSFPEAEHGFIETNNPEYDRLPNATMRSAEQEAMARQAEKDIGAWIAARDKK